ncbi:hypothetical protein PHYPSEUDO_010952 [Phytophthora pseudosyringae]|uniref:Uncharacterized protein n=1 Tax=Phytophthora pseudosyringae TaxID=221518 RepID=A0A8T1VEA3_9STRA|nr:hypothetical protein PHYPSEUDO_010941 [Phytophthora pseudosyringae]KAG7377814.1 hypothetical protein PHYPSEUDO_010952 [Phytophthora pseudosyringae]
MVICKLEGDDHPPVALNNNDTNDARTSQATAVAAAAAAGNESERFTEKVEKIKRQSLEPIPQADTREFPADNDRLFPQEKVFPGLRGQKVSLLELSNAKGLPLVPPGNYFLLRDASADALVILMFLSHCSELLGWHLSSPQPIRRQR